ncbi:MAG: cyclic nucleotide-binding domain-containing protein [Polyangiales bacterium]
MSYAYEFSPVGDLGPIEQMRALRRLFGADAPTSNEALAAISRLTMAQRVAAGTVLSRQGEPFGHVFLIIDGALELTYDGEQLGVFPAGTGVGAISALSADQVGFTCTALEDSTLLTLTVQDLLEVLEDHFELMHSALVNLATEAIAWRRALMPNAGFSNELRAEHSACTGHALSLVERMIYLRQTIGLEQSYIDELAELARAASEVRFPAGVRLWTPGDAAAYLMIVVSGEVRAKSPEGAEFCFGPGDILGNLDTIAGVPRWFEAHAQRDLVALTLDSEAIVDVWEDHPALGFAFLRMLSRLLLSLRVQAAKLQVQAVPS